MINYIELNGKKSTDVKGLMIQSLPPITKPKVRTSIEDIDGRDGDIVTKLGYAAYDKEVNIGLHGDFDIDDVISFFDSEGEVVFSNEPDKYYRYQILDQIDFERLIRFRTAKVKMHVQPFKYDAVDRELDIVNQLLHVKNMNWTTKFGVRAAVEDELFMCSGTATSTVEFYIPIEPLKLTSGTYTLAAKCDGYADGAAIRLIADSPATSASFGKSYISLKNDAAPQLTASDAGELTYNYIWFYVPSGTTVNFSMDVSLSNSVFNNFTITNRGNCVSKPRYTVYGSGFVTIDNDIYQVQMNIKNEFITVDVEDMNAYYYGTLMNRQVVGDPLTLSLDVGQNKISWTGTVTEIIVTDYSRWI